MTRQQAEAFAQYLAERDDQEYLVVQDRTPNAPPSPNNFYWTSDYGFYRNAAICARYSPRPPRRGQERRSLPKAPEGLSAGDKASESPPAPAERRPDKTRAHSPTTTSPALDKFLLDLEVFPEG